VSSTIETAALAKGLVVTLDCESAAKGITPCSRLARPRPSTSRSCSRARPATTTTRARPPLRSAVSSRAWYSVVALTTA
jgi:hypothetical protein